MSTVRTYETGVDQRFFAQTARRKQCSKYRHDVTERAEPPGCEVVGGHEIFGMVRMSPTYLPRRSGESRFAPAQYYYQASKTGAVPSWRYQ